MKEILHKELSYKITGLCFQVQKELGRFCREKQYADRLEELLKENGLNYEREFEIKDVHTSQTTGNRVDFLIENKIIVDLKAKNFIFKDDYFQMQRYLRSLDLELGMIINFRSAHLKPKRVLNGENENYKKSKNSLFGAFGFNSLYSDRFKGFSFLELMIVIAIIGIMTVVALVYISKSNRSGKEVEFAAREVAVAIREAQNNALGGKQPDAGMVACVHGFYFNASGATDYKIFYNLKPAGADCPTASKDHSSSTDYISYSLSNGVQFSAGSGAIYFDSPHGNIFRDGTLLASTLTITVFKDSQNYNICVYPSGNVIESKDACP